MTTVHLSGRIALGHTLLALGGAFPVAGQQQVLPLPLPSGSSIVQTLSFPGGDRESVHTVQEAGPAGSRWTWAMVEVQAQDTTRNEFRYYERVEDLTEAIRLRLFHGASEPEMHPGYTMHAISRAVYRRLGTAGRDTFQVMALEAPSRGAVFADLGLGVGRALPVRWRGSLSAGGQPEPFPLLVNGERVTVPALRLRGSFRARSNRWDPQIWVLADSTYPLVLKWLGAHQQEGNLLQTIRVDFPVGPPAGAEGSLEGALRSRCRVELPGIYFAFNSAALNPASDRAIAELAAVLTKHPAWTGTLEGHTDSIGTITANAALSLRRVEAVRARLVSRHGIQETRLRTAGQGSSRPRESNATVEGRARNRRVELVRDCPEAAR